MHEDYKKSKIFIPRPRKFPGKFLLGLRGPDVVITTGLGSEKFTYPYSTYTIFKYGYVNFSLSNPVYLLKDNFHNHPIHRGCNKALRGIFDTYLKLW